MPSQISIYWKIQVVLSFCKSAEISSIEDLKEKILKREFKNFETFQYNKEKDQVEKKQSYRVIRRTVNFCRMLNLIGENGCLTNIGIQALQRKKFETIINKQIHALLDSKGISLVSINEIIHKGLKAVPPIMPTSKELWNSICEKIGYSIFSKLLTLLSQCGGAQSSQKKIYLLIE